MKKVFLTTGSNEKWAIAEDFSTTRESIKDIVELTTLENSEVVHMIWWEGFYNLNIPKNKIIVCHLTGEPFRYMALPGFTRFFKQVDYWIAHSKQAYEQCISMGIKATIIPYCINSNKFYFIQKDNKEIQNFKTSMRIPENTYLIGNFHRDSEGKNLYSPKLVKGPDVFLEMLKILKNKNLDFCAVIAGPRRHWLLNQLKLNNIKFVYIGSEINKDDMNSSNLLDYKIINKLHNVIDTYVISSRSEGGPRTLLESLVAKRKVISTPVGMAEDILDEKLIYRSAFEGSKILEEDIKNNSISEIIKNSWELVENKYTINSNKKLYQEFYSSIDPKKETKETITVSNNPINLSILHNFTKPPYGGGNQFLLALKKYLVKNKINVMENYIGPNANVYLVNSVQFNINQLLGSGKNIKIVHRIDGPISFIRGKDEELDRLCFDINKKYAKFSVVQSGWTLKQINNMGYNPVNSILIQNASDKQIFNRENKSKFSNKKTKLISTSWSDNVRKGLEIYKWLDENLNYDKYEYVFVGRIQTQFKNIKIIAPVDSVSLSNILKENDIYITASQKDPCSNALIEALSCGLPALYLNDGGHPEIVKYGGLSFNTEKDIISSLDIISNNYESFQNNIVVEDIENITKKYIEIFRMIA